MHEKNSLRQNVAFGLFEVDFRAGELRKRGLRIRLQEKPFRILAALLKRPGELVTREALRNELWPSDTFVDFDRSLNTALRKLREALGDSAENPRFVETLSRRGYRFIAPVGSPGALGSEGPKRMLAVLPFECLPGDSDKEYFVDGLTEELTCQLGQLDTKHLGVIARTSAMRYKGTKKSVREIGAELKCGYVLEGSVRQDGTSIRITAQLIEVLRETHLWSASYDRSLQDILNVQQDVARRVGTALALELLPEQRSRAMTVNPMAHEAYLRGRYFWGQRTEVALTNAVAYFEKALSIDPQYSRAYSGIADCYNLLCWFGAMAPRESGPLAGTAAARALELDDSISEGHASLALVRFWYEWDWTGAEEEFLRAIELNPSYAAAHHWYASYLNAMGRLEEAQVRLGRARELDPLSLIISMSAADPLFYGRRFDEAIEHLLALLDHEPQFLPALFNLGRVYVQKGMYQEAVSSFEKVRYLSGNPQAYPTLAHAYALAGQTHEARKILKQLTEPGERFPGSPLIARIHLGLGESARAIEWLRKGVEERSYWMTMLKADPIYDEIRSDPRFRGLLKQVGFHTEPSTAPRKAKVAGQYR
jgi:TolB-like protein/Tfp pilus assembly protein PilF